MEKDVKLARKTPVFLSAGLLAINGLAFAGDLIGQASVIDGDTIEIHGTSIRIFGIDAPESDQLCLDEDGEPYRCGQKASNALFDLIDRRPVECVEVGYADAQAEAKREQRGMWAGSFKEPWNYRACKRSGGRPQSCSDD
jgi:endonuclease YncB( thermonuclease family)